MNLQVALDTVGGLEVRVVHNSMIVLSPNPNKTILGLELSTIGRDKRF